MIYNIRKTTAFTLFELIITLILISVLATFVFIVINPMKFFADGRNTQRMGDLNNIKVALNRYIADTDSNGNIRHLYSIDGYQAMMVDYLANKNAVCPGGSNGITNAITGSYDLSATSGTSLFNIQPLLTANYLLKIPKDSSNTPYKICIDPSNNFKLVLFSSVKESSSSTYASTVIDINPSPNVNFIHNPNSDTDNLGWGSNGNDTITNVASGCAYLNGLSSGNRYFANTPTTNKYNYMQAIEDITPSNYLASGTTYSFSTDVDKGSYVGTVMLEIKYTMDNINWINKTTTVTTPGRYSVSFQIPDNALDVQSVVSGYGESTKASGDPSGTYYFDNAQLEFQPLPTTYFNGDNGVAGVYWVGVPHFSPSYRLE